MSNGDEPADVAIVGAGPAGVSAALWAATYALEVQWFAADGEIGGMLERVANPVRNYPGVAAPGGPSLARALRRQLSDTEMEGPVDAYVDRIVRTDSGHWRIESDSVRTVSAHNVLLATGTTYRQLDVPGESEGLGSYVSQSTSRDAEAFARRTVGMVGGGDAAFEGALQLANERARVHMLLRSQPTDARTQFLEPARDHDRIFIHDIPSRVSSIEPVETRDTCRVEIETTDRRNELEVACLFVRIGVDPVYPELEPHPAVDDPGYLKVDRRQATSVDSLFAAGDVTDTPLPAVATAVGDGAAAIHAIADDLGLA